MSVSVKMAFDKSAQSYDRSRRQLIPCFDDFYHTALSLIPYNTSESFSVLDLGAGTGLMSLFVHSRFPHASITLTDISDKMLDRAKERFSDSAGSFSYLISDYRDGLRGKYDIIISALSIHHLDAGEKKKLFSAVYLSLETGGVFINADQVLGCTPSIEKIYRSRWMDFVEKSGLTKEELSAALDRLKEDKMDTLDDQLSWLKSAGFGSVDCWYKNYSFVVYSGTK